MIFNNKKGQWQFIIPIVLGGLAILGIQIVGKQNTGINIPWWGWAIGFIMLWAFLNRR